MSSNLKTEVSASNFELDMREADLNTQARKYRAVDGARVALTMLGFAAGVAVLGMSANAIAVYNSTHLPVDFHLPLWPRDFNLRPTVAMVAGSSIVVAANGVSLLTSKTAALRERRAVSTPVSLAAPVISFIGALIAMIFYYAVNASTTVDSIHSWSCRWRNVSMLTQPHFGTLCKQSEAGLGLTIMLVPLQLVVLGVAGYQMGLARSLDLVGRLHVPKSSASPALS